MLIGEQDAAEWRHPAATSKTLVSQDEIDAADSLRGAIASQDAAEWRHPASTSKTLVSQDEIDAADSLRGAIARQTDIGPADDRRQAAAIRRRGLR